MELEAVPSQSIRLMALLRPLAFCPLERSPADGAMGAAILPAPAVHPRPAALSPGRLCGPRDGMPATPAPPLGAGVPRSMAQNSTQGMRRGQSRAPNADSAAAVRGAVEISQFELSRQAAEKVEIKLSQSAKSCSLAPLLSLATSQFGLRPRPVHVSERLSGLAYLAALAAPAPRPRGARATG